MSVNSIFKFFYLFLLLLMCGTLCGQVSANGELPKTSTAENPVNVFEKKEKLTSVLKPTDDTQEDVKGVTVQEFYSPAFVSSGDVIVALAAINDADKKIDNNITVLTKYIDTKNELNWGEKIVSKNPEWIARFAVYKECSNNCVDTSVVRGFVAAVKAGKIYLLSVNADTKLPDSLPNGAYTLNFGLAEGTVAEKKVTWVEKPLNLANQKVTDHFKEQTLSKGVFSGSAIVTKEENILFLLKAQTKDKQKVLGFYFSNGVDKANDLKLLSFDKIAEGCYPQFFLWENKIIMVPTHCEGGVKTQKVKATTDFAKETWVDSPEPFSHLVDFFHDKSDFTTVTIQKNTNNNNNDVLLFTQKKKPKQQPTSNDNCDVYLWATDGKRFYNAGTFLNDVNVTSINLLYIKDELLALYQQWGQDGPKNIVLKRLKTQLSNITTVIDAWKNNDETVKKLCDDKILCTPLLSTAGLVGFLANNSEDTKQIWKDEYYYVNVTLKLKPNDNTNNKVEKVTGGFTFSGDGVGAQWLEGKEEKDQPYKLTDPGFTLVATVTINKHKNFDNSLLGVVINGNEKPIQLWCSNGKWAVGEKKTILDKKACEQGKTYIVTLVLNNDGNVLLHVDWEQMTDVSREEMKIEKTDIIKYFYFGAGSDTLTSAKTDVTVTNVLLYNRPFGASEINELKVIKKEAAQPTTKNGDNNTHDLDGKSTGETEKPSSTSATPTATEKDGAEIKLCLFSMNGVTMLLSLFFGVFTLLGRYVY